MSVCFFLITVTLDASLSLRCTKTNGMWRIRGLCSV